MNKTINKEETLYSIYKKYPEIVDILYDFGFTQIKLPQMIQTAGRMMSLEKGCSMRGFDYTQLTHVLLQHGFIIEEDNK
jgi:hypothetical protein